MVPPLNLGRLLATLAFAAVTAMLVFGTIKHHAYGADQPACHDYQGIYMHAMRDASAGDLTFELYDQDETARWLREAKTHMPAVELTGAKAIMITPVTHPLEVPPGHPSARLVVPGGLAAFVFTEYDCIASIVTLSPERARVIREQAFGIPL